MGKSILLALACGAAGAAISPILGTTIYSSPFQCAYPVGAAFKTVGEVANIWSWTGVVPPGGIDVLVDIDGNNQMDTSVPGVRVTITDMVNYSGGGSQIDIEDTSGLRWRMSSGTGHIHHLVTPIVLPFDSNLHLANNTGFGSSSTVTLIGRVVNL